MQYDDIIVGAGSSGAVLAARLTEDPARGVLLLEAGPDYPAASLPADLADGWSGSMDLHDWHWSAKFGPAREQLPYPRGKVTGGSSAVNGAVALRGAPADYDEWAALGNDAWSFEKLLPFFRRLEDDRDIAGDFHGQGGPIPLRRFPEAELFPLARAFRDACRDLGFVSVEDHNDPEATGIGPIPMNLAGTLRVSTALAYLEPARHRLNLTIRGGCLVDRVIFEEGRAVGLQVESDGLRQVVRGRRITLSAGAIASPAILLRSGIGPAAALAKLGIPLVADLPGVGENLIDHCWVLVTAQPREGTTSPADPNFQQILRYASAGSGEFNDMQLYCIHKLSLASRPELIPLFGGRETIFAIAAGLQRPRARGRVRLTSRDPHTQPAIDLRYATHPEDIARLMDGARLAWRVLQTPAMTALWEGAVLPSPETFEDEQALRVFIRMTAATIYHPAGTARMGPDGDAAAVVDQFCRVRGVEGLRVVDASIMPNIPRANTNLTCIAIGERVAAWMGGDPG